MFGIELSTILLTLGIYGLLISAVKIHRYERKISKELMRARAKVMRSIARYEQAKSLNAAQQQAKLPRAFQEENWNRCFYGEPTDENAILASTGCQLTDAIFHAAHEAGVDIVSFYRHPLSDLLNGQISHEVGCGNSGIDQKQRCLG